MHTSVYIQAPGCLIKIRNWEFVDGPPCSFFSSAESFPDGWLGLIVYLLGDAKPAIMAAARNGHGVTLVCFSRLNTQN